MLMLVTIPLLFLLGSISVSVKGVQDTTRQPDTENPITTTQTENKTHVYSATI